MSQGLFKLQSARDLLDKLRYDLGRLEREPLDQYAAFDFFVTAWHVLDWLYPGEDVAAKKMRKSLRNGSLILQVCDQLANGSKHFEASATRHNSVRGTELHAGAFSSAFSSAFDTGKLVVHLDGKAATSIGTQIGVLDLARRTLSELEPMIP